MARWHSCIVLDPSPKARHLWQFNPAANKILRQEAILPTEPLPESLVAKDWPNLFQPKLNIAWLPAEQVFLRVIQLPKSTFEETLSMVELQLEKLSPMPVAQILWTFELIPQPAGDMQTALVIIVARQQVEQFLGKLEEQQFLPDRLELPLIDQLRATQITEDGVWIYPEVGADPFTCLIAWWTNGVLCQVSLLSLPPDQDQARGLQEHLTQISWAGEIEGWLASTTRYHIVARPEVGENWKKLFPPEQVVEVIPTLPADQLAAMTVRRAVSEETRVNLLPPEHTKRYHQLLTDRLWMRALAAVGILYILGAAIYLGWAQVIHWQYGRVETQVAELGPAYTNTIRLKEEVRVLQDQRDLQYAALEAWKAVAEELPSELTLDTLSFQRGRTLSLQGTATAGAAEEIITFNEHLQNKKLHDQRLFKEVSAPRTDQRSGQLFWNFSAEMNRAEPE